MSIINTTKFLGIPFVNKGRSLEGCDCWGLVQMIFREHGVEVPEYGINCDCRDWKEIHSHIEKARKQWNRIDKPKVPCLVVLRSVNVNAPISFTDHVAVFVGEGKMMHTIEKLGSHITKINHPLWNRKIEGFYEFVG